MRTKKEIEDRIKSLEATHKAFVQVFAHVDNINPTACHQFAILILHWVLGKELGKLHYCYTCQIIHENLMCPICNDSSEVRRLPVGG